MQMVSVAECTNIKVVNACWVSTEISQAKECVRPHLCGTCPLGVEQNYRILMIYSISGFCFISALFFLFSIILIYKSEKSRKKYNALDTRDVCVEKNKRSLKLQVCNYIWTLRLHELVLQKVYRNIIFHMVYSAAQSTAN